jgi:hypothetical protein
MVMGLLIVDQVLSWMDGLRVRDMTWWRGEDDLKAQMEILKRDLLDILLKSFQPNHTTSHFNTNLLNLIQVYPNYRLTIYICCDKVLMKIKNVFIYLSYQQLI